MPEMEDVHQAGFMYLEFTCKPGESCRKATQVLVIVSVTSFER